MLCWDFPMLARNRPGFYRDQSCWKPLYVTIDNLRSGSVHTHSFVELTLVTQGGSRQSRFFGEKEDLQTQEFTQGDLFGFLPGECHDLKLIGKGGTMTTLYDVTFDPEMLDAGLWQQMLQLPGLQAILQQRQVLHLPPPLFQELSGRILHLLQELYQQQTGYQWNLSGLLTDLLIRIGRITRESAEAPGNPHAEKAEAFIRKHYAEPLTLQKIAQASGVGRTHLCHLFQETRQMSIWDFLNHVRIERAKFFLQASPDAAIYEIASMCGFADSSYFSRIFRKLEGVSPAAYLRNLKQ